MRCANCGHVNDEGARFCEACGKPLPAACRNCQAPLKPSSRFCTRCGTPVEAPLTEGPDRRQLTVMFCDLVAFTALTARLDPEDLTTVIKAYQHAVVAGVRRYEGFVARYFGDGVLAYFGYPRAHEDAAERAVRAGLDIVDDLGRLRISHVDDLQVRVGIATGQVVVGDLIGEGASEEATVLGVTPNLAARLQGLAEPNQVLMAAETWKLVCRAFRGVDMGSHTVKGLTEPVHVWRATEVIANRVAEQGGSQLVVGRDAEAALLEQAWARAAEGRGQVVVITAEPGVGKSTLVRRFRGRDAVDVMLTGSPFHKNSAFYAVAMMLKAELGSTPPEVEAALDRLGLSELAPLLLDLMGLSEQPGEGSLDRKARQIDAVIRLLRTWSGTRSLLCVVEDAHWVDPSTLELLERLAREGQGAAQMLLFATRPERTFRPPGVDVVQISLGRLSREETAAIVHAMVADAQTTLPKARVEEIVRRADGVPLYAEELTRAVIEGESGAIPTTLQDSLMGRLDRLSAKGVAQLAATVGRTFSLDQLSAVTNQPEDELRAALDELMASGLVHPGGGSTYVFKHSLVRDAAYGSLLRNRRLEAHSRLAAYLAANDAAPDLVAQHQAAASQHAAALQSYRRAADIASRRWAYVEANAHLRSALGCLDKGEPDPALRQDLLVALGAGLRVVEDFQAAQSVLGEAIRLGLLGRDATQLSQANYLLGGVAFSVGDIEGCMRAHTQARDLAEQAGSLRHQAQALSGIGDAHYARGHMQSQFDVLDRCVRLAESDPALDVVVITNLAPRGVARTYIGQFRAAVADGEEGVRRARERGLLRVQMLAHGTSPIFANVALGEFDAVEHHSLSAQELAKRVGARQILAGTAMMRAMVRVFAGHGDGLELARDSLEAVRRDGMRFFGGWALGVVARATPDRGERDELLTEGKLLVNSPVISHNVLWFSRLALETHLLAGEWDEADAVVDSLDAYTKEQRLVWSDLVMRAGRLLVARGRGDRNDDALGALRAELTRFEWLTLLRFVERCAS